MTEPPPGRLGVSLGWDRSPHPNIRVGAFSVSRSSRAPKESID